MLLYAQAHFVQTTMKVMMTAVGDGGGGGGGCGTTFRIIDSMFE